MSIEPVGRANSRLYKEELAKLINENINIDPAQTRSNLESFSISPDEESEIDENLDLNLKNPQLLNPPNADEEDIRADYQPQTLTSQPTPEQSPETRADADKSLHDKQFREADSVYFSEPADADVS